MKGYAMLEIGKAGWIEIDKPKCGPLDAICAPIAVAPCTSDIHTVWAGALGKRENMILGHEAIGEVVEVGELVRDFKPGDRVIVPAITPDWNTIEAQRGYAMHSGGMLSGWKFSNFKDGVFAEYFHINDADGNLAHLPKDLSPKTACMLCDMIPTGLHGVELANVEFGDDVVVIGIGPVGLMSVAGAAIHGAARIFAVGSRPNCITLAKEYGATKIINYKSEPIDSQIFKLTDNKGVDKVIIAGGDTNTFKDAVRMLKPGGKIGNINYLGEGQSISIPRVDWGVGMGHKAITGGLMPGGRLRMEKLSALITSGRIHPEKMITHEFRGFEGIEKALMLMKEKPKDLIKPIVLL